MVSALSAPHLHDEQAAFDHVEARVRAEFERLVAAGELSPTEADERFDRLLDRATPSKP